MYLVHVGQSGILADNVHFRLVPILTFIIIVVPLVLLGHFTMYLCFCIPIEQCFIRLNNLLLDVVTATLKECDHSNIFQTTKSACDKWRAIGWGLDFTTDELDAIVREPGRNGDEDYYEAMLRRWLDWAPPNHTSPSLQSLLSALRAAGKERQANYLAAKYKVRGHTESVCLLLCGARGSLRVLGRLLL